MTTQRIERDIAPVLEQYQTQLARQQGLVETLQFLSPALLAHNALAKAAGTGLARHHWFFAQAVAHHGELRAFFEPQALRKEKFTAWDDVPAFNYVEEPMASVFARVMPGLAALILAALMLGAWSWRSLQRCMPFG